MPLPVRSIIIENACVFVFKLLQVSLAGQPADAGIVATPGRTIDPGSEVTANFTITANGPGISVETGLVLVFNPSLNLLSYTLTDPADPSGGCYPFWVCLVQLYL